MSTSVGRIDLDLGINWSTFHSEMNSISGKATGLLTGAFKGLGVVIAAAFATKKLIDFGEGCVELASNLFEVQNVVDVTFGNMKNQINDFSKTALQQFGLSELSAKKYASTMGAMLKSSGIGGQKMTDMSKDITGLAADMASFYNISNDKAFAKIRSGMSGMTAPLKELGVSMLVANLQSYAYSQGITKSYKEMNNAEKTLLRYNYLMSVTKDAQGDFTRTQGSWANQARLMSEQWNIFKLTMGQGFINVLTPVVRLINTIIQKLQIAAQYFRAFTVAIFGDAQAKIAGTSKKVSESNNDIAASTGKAADAVAKAGKKVKNSLLPFDQLNMLTKQTASSMDDMAGATDYSEPTNIGGHSADPVKVDANMFNPLKNAIKEIKKDLGDLSKFMKNTFGPPLKEAWSIIEPELLKWKKTLLETFRDFGTLLQPVKDWLTNDLVPFMQNTIVRTAQIWAGLSDSLRPVFEGIRNAIFPVLKWLATDGLPLVTDFADGIQKVFMSLFNNTKTIFDTLWSGAIEPGLSLLSSMTVDCLNILKGFWDTFGSDIVNGLMGVFDSIKALFNTLWSEFLKPVWNRFLMELTTLWNKHFKGLITEVTTFVGKLVTAVLEITNKFIKPLLNDLIHVLAPGFKIAFKTLIGVVGTLLGTFADVAKGIIKVLGGVVDFITGVLTGNWKKAFGGLGSIVKGIFDGIVGVVKGAINLMIDGVNLLIDALKLIKIPEVNVMGKKLFGGLDLGKNLHDIPHLANGGLVSQPTLAMVGDNRNAKSDPEVVAPLSKLKSMMGNSNNLELVAILTKILDAIGNIDSGFMLKIGEQEFGRLCAKSIKSASRQAGVNLLMT